MEVLRVAFAFGVISLVASLPHPGGLSSYGSDSKGSKGSSGTSYVSVSRVISSERGYLVKKSQSEAVDSNAGGSHGKNGDSGSSEENKKSNGSGGYGSASSYLVYSPGKSETDGVLVTYGKAEGGSKEESGYGSIAYGKGEKKEEKIIDYYAKPEYKYEYKVEDPHTGDFKSQKESRDGDKVEGAYELKEPDGTVLEVRYVADKKNGFNAEVLRKGKSQHPEPSKKSYY